jgi:catabolite regulation protein CreA
MGRLAMTKGSTADELRRNKEKSRKTQVFLSQSKKVTSSSTKAGDTTSPERSMKQTMLSGGGSNSGA